MLAVMRVVESAFLRTTAAFSKKRVTLIHLALLRMPKNVIGTVREHAALICNEADRSLIQLSWESINVGTAHR